MNSEEEWTADQLAEYLGIKRRSVYTFARRLAGFPTARYVGRTPLWKSAEVKAWRKDHPARQRRS